MRKMNIAIYAILSVSIAMSVATAAIFVAKFW